MIVSDSYEIHFSRGKTSFFSWLLLFCGPQHSGVNSSDTQVLTLYNITEEEGGEYICKVSNYIGEANQSAWLTVLKHEAQGKHLRWAVAGKYTGLDEHECIVFLSLSSFPLDSLTMPWNLPADLARRLQQGAVAE